MLRNTIIADKQLNIADKTLEIADNSRNIADKSPRCRVYYSAAFIPAIRPVTSADVIL